MIEKWKHYKYLRVLISKSNGSDAYLKRIILNNCR